MTNRLIEETKEYVRQYFMANVGEEYSYHNYDHTLSVTAAAEKLAIEARLNDEEKEMLLLASLFHDTGFGVDPSNHEYHSEEIAREYLQALNYPQQKIDIIVDCIRATRMDWKGESKICFLMRDADLSNLANSKYQQIAEKLRREKNATEDKAFDKNQWIRENISFIQNHYYCTEEARRLFDEGKKENLKKLKKLEGKKKEKKPKLLTIGSSKSAQTQLKTALRNHIDLSAIADNKANIMLSVNAIVITVGLPILIDRSYTHPEMIIPTAILAAASLISMIFATLSTRPAKMKGETTNEMIRTKKSNLFFFGNFYRMGFEEYEDGMRTVVGDNEILDNSITRDLFYLGKSLGMKFKYLRWCYNIFMYGIGIAMISFIIVLLVNRA